MIDPYAVMIQEMIRVERDEVRELYHRLPEIMEYLLEAMSKSLGIPEGYLYKNKKVTYQ